MKILILISLFISSHSFASYEFNDLFNDLYYSEYQAQRCGENIRELLSYADAKGLGIDHSKVLVLRNNGLSALGQVNALYARTPSLQYSANERNWRFHVVLMKGNFIYDFDYGNEPIINTIEQYFHKMFLNSQARSRFKVDPEHKKSDYSVEFYAPEDYLRGNERIIKKMSLGSFLNTY